MTHLRPPVPKKATYRAFENFLTGKYERIAGILAPRSYPYVMTIDPTNICQLRCRGCMTGLENEARKRRRYSKVTSPLARIKHDLLEAMLDEFGDVMFYCNFYNWGEPLLHENLPDIVRAVSERGVYTALDSNLSVRVRDGMLEDLLLAGLDELGASIDGVTQETYENYRVGGQLDLALGNLKRLAEIRDAHGLDTEIVWKFLIFSYNEHEVEQAAEFCRQHRIVFLPRDAFFMQNYAQWKPAYQREGKPNPYRRDRRPQLNSSLYVTPEGMLNMTPGKPAHRSCGWHYAYSTVNPDGSVVPCCALFSRKFDFGTVTPEPGSFGKVWRNENFQAVRRDFPAGLEVDGDGPTTACTTCKRSENFLDHYQVRDREIVRKFWASLDDPELQPLEGHFRLLQRAPEQFAETYAEHYRGRELAAVS